MAEQTQDLHLALDFSADLRSDFPHYSRASVQPEQLMHLAQPEKVQRTTLS